jgi:DNA-binding MarR family transcriptional regulator
MNEAEFEVANRLFFRLYQASNLMHKHGTRHVEPFGATTQQWAALGALARPRVAAEGMTVKDLVGFLGVSRQNLSQVLDRLEGRGWIERVVDAEDARSRRIRLTASGNAAWSAMQAPIEAFYTSALAPLDASERAALADLLERLRTALSAAPAPAAPALRGRVRALNPGAELPAPRRGAQSENKP